MKNNSREKKISDNVHKCFNRAKNNMKSVISVRSAVGNRRRESRKSSSQVPFLENGRTQPPSVSSDPLLVAFPLLLSGGEMYLYLHGSLALTHKNLKLSVKINLFQERVLFCW